MNVLSGRGAEHWSALTNIDEAARLTLAELLALVRQSDLDHAGDLARRRLDANRVRRNQLTPHEHRAENDLQSVKEIITDNNYLRPANGPALAWRNRFDARRRDRHRRIEACRDEIMLFLVFISKRFGTPSPLIRLQSIRMSFYSRRLTLRPPFSRLLRGEWSREPRKRARNVENVAAFSEATRRRLSVRRTRIPADASERRPESRKAKIRECRLSCRSRRKWTAYSFTGAVDKRKQHFAFDGNVQNRCVSLPEKYGEKNRAFSE